TVEFSDGTTTKAMSAAWVKSTFGLKSIYFDIVLGVFSDIAGSVHADAIIAIYERGITKGCNPPLNTLYCPEGLLTRGQ
ncbi:MAG: S-layer homology domain-containing protein, partial [Actinobacteria bacterium]|nr:S-layer homology domain-containing protein [Actinomycetota bacterium]